MASIYILFPKENQELAGSAMQHFQWTTQRFEAMAERNRLARSAQAVLQAIYVKFRKAVGNPTLPPTTCSLPTPASDSAQSYAENPSAGSATDTPPPGKAMSGLTPSEAAETTASSYPPPSTTSEWTMPNDFDFASITPLYPMADVIYNDVTGIPDGPGLMPGWGAETPTAEIGLQPWQFEGDFGSDSVWNLLNQYKLGPYQ